MVEFEQEVIMNGFGTENFKEGPITTYKLFSDDEWGRELLSPVLHISIDGSPFFPLDGIEDRIESIKKNLNPVSRHTNGL